jgi:hypothetical protein
MNRILKSVLRWPTGWKAEEWGFGSSWYTRKCQLRAPTVLRLAKQVLSFYFLIWQRSQLDSIVSDDRMDWKLFKVGGCSLIGVLFRHLRGGT